MSEMGAVVPCREMSGMSLQGCEFHCLTSPVCVISFLCVCAVLAPLRRVKSFNPQRANQNAAHIRCILHVSPAPAQREKRGNEDEERLSLFFLFRLFSS